MILYRYLQFTTTKNNLIIVNLGSSDYGRLFDFYGRANSIGNLDSKGQEDQPEQQENSTEHITSFNRTHVGTNLIGDCR